MHFDHIPTPTEWLKASAATGDRADSDRQAKTRLARIDELIVRYHRVLDMSRLNVLMELRTAIVDWLLDKLKRRVGTSRLSAMQALEEIVVRRLYELEDWGTHRYLKAVCIGYEVKTGAYEAWRQPKDARQRAREERADVDQRVKDLIQAIRLAESRYAARAALRRVPPDDQAATLKIFMAPEFFFRGPYGAYADVGLCHEILQQLRAEIGQPKYADWLFVQGTALFATDLHEEGQRIGVMLENYALVQKGGPKTRETHDHVIAKEFPSHVDFQFPGDQEDWFHPHRSKAYVGGELRVHARPEGGRKDPGFAKKPKIGPALSELTGGSIFTMHNISFGLEVCRDHYLKRLASSKESGKVQIQLIPSAGMSIDRHAMACVSGGLVFNVDGDTPHVQLALRSGNGWRLPVNVARCGAGQLVMFDPQPVAWPPPVSRTVARHLGMDAAVLGGSRPIGPPPLPARD